MKIVSPYHDFYDISMQYGTDQTLVYARIPEVVKCNSVQGFGYYPGHSWRNEYSITKYSREGFTIGFCGKLCFGFKILDHFIYSVEELDKFVNTLHKKIQENYYRHNTNRAKRYTWFSAPEGTRQYFESLFKRLQEHTNTHQDLFYQLNCPIFVANWKDRKQVVTKNQCLKDFQFQRIIDPYTAYQEVSMFLGGVLANQGKIVPIPDDITMRDIKGFDKWSFRKEPKGG